MRAALAAAILMVGLVACGAPDDTDPVAGPASEAPDAPTDTESDYPPSPDVTVHPTTGVQPPTTTTPVGGPYDTLAPVVTAPDASRAPIYRFDASTNATSRQMGRIADAFDVGIMFDPSMATTVPNGTVPDDLAHLWIDKGGYGRWRYLRAGPDLGHCALPTIPTTAPVTTRGPLPCDVNSPNAPSIEVATRRTIEALDGLGVDADRLATEAETDGWTTVVAVAELTDDGAMRGREWTFRYGANGELRSASGWANPPELVGEVALMDAEEALERLEVLGWPGEDPVVSGLVYRGIAGEDGVSMLPHYTVRGANGARADVPAVTEAELAEIGIDLSSDPTPRELGVSEPEPTTTSSPSTAPPVESSLPFNTVPARVTVEIVEIHDDVEFYTACGTQPLEFNGQTWYQLPLHAFEGIVDTIEAVRREPIPRVHGFARVAPPGPGDDVGTLYIYADGVAWFISDSGDLETWLRLEPVEANWVC